MILNHRIGVDIDGVLARFDVGFIKKLREADCAIDFPVDDPTFPPVWEWPKFYGVTREQEDRAWELVKRDGLFWAKLPALAARDEFDLLRAMIDGDWQIYFITTRPGLLAQQQTSAWLSVRGISFPSVLIADGPHQKGRLAKGLNLDALIDDRPANLEALPVGVRPFLKLAPYNLGWFEAHDRDTGEGNVQGVNSIREMVGFLIEEEQGVAA